MSIRIKKAKPVYREIEPAGADRKEWDKLEPLFDDDRWYAEPKYDGWRFLLHVGGGLDRVYLTGRNVSKKTGRYSEKGQCAPKFAPPPKWMQKLAYTVLDGEVLPPQRAGFRDIAGIMNVEPEDAAQRIKEIGHPEYHVFDCLFHGGEDVRGMEQHIRLDMAQEIVATVWRDSDYVWSARSVYGLDKRTLYQDQMNSGAEGIILKHKDAPYGKSGAWLKVKRMHTLDVVITGFTPAKEGKTGKYKGLIGAVKVSVHGAGGKLVEIGQVSGMDDELRKAISANPKQYVGKALEIKAQEFAKDRLRHPRWSRLRPDITDTQRSCTWIKMEQDLAANKSKEK